MHVHLGAIMIFAKDLPRLRDFYCDGLGFSPAPNQPAPEEFLILEAAAVPHGASPAATSTAGAIALHKIPEEIARDIEILDPPLRRSDVALKFVLHTTTLDEVRAALQSRGATVDAIHEWDRSRYFDAVDPEGNVFQVATIFKAGSIA